ncbi:MAG: nitrilase-related carbon-nitrogen hydrolase, partial [Candidatus Neoclostridium sp.]
MNDGFIKVAAITPRVRVADTQYNARSVCENMLKAAASGAKIMVFPELCLTGYTCADLFYHEALTDGALKALSDVAACSVGVDALVIVGCPVRKEGKLYNCAVAICGGKILGVVPKTFLPNYNEFYEKRWFAPAPQGVEPFELLGQSTFFG